MLFRRNEDEDNDELDEERTVKIRDLKKGNRKKRDAPLKPWGKAERFLVASLLVGSVLGALGLAISSRHGKLPGLPRLSAPDLGLTQTIILQNSAPLPADEARSQKTKNDFKKATSALSGLYALSIVDLKTGNAFGVNDTEVMQAASLIKLPVMIAAYSEYEKGHFALDNKYTLKDNDKVGGSGSLQYKKAGTVFTYRQLLSYMGQQSDNTAFNVVRKKLTDNLIDTYISEFNLKSTFLNDNTTTPAEIAMLFQKIFSGSYLASKDKDELLDFMTNTIYEDHLVKGIPSNIKVAHKYGREVHVVNDGGIVFGTRPYVVVIMTDGVVETEADNVFPTLSKIVYEDMEE